MNVLSDHAIALLTVNGEVVFRSFFSRDECYNLIKKTFAINTEDIFFEEDDAENSFEDDNVSYEDDMKE